jgi:glutamine amidotransferase
VTRVGIIDVGTSNLGSLSAVVSRLGATPTVITDPNGLDNFSHLILPGVGEFAEASKRLVGRGFLSPIQDIVAQGIPFLGICLGMQLMATNGDEGGNSEGLSLVKGNVVKMENSSEARVPHVGWNSVEQQNIHPLFLNIPSDADFYFVHGFVVSGVPNSNVLGLTKHGDLFPSAIQSGSAVGVQFHPEKSQHAGSLLLSNFFSWSGGC